MRVWELLSGIYVHLTEEESSLIDKLRKEGGADLTGREIIVADKLVQKGILSRIEHPDYDEYKIITKPDVWRD